MLTVGRRRAPKGTYLLRRDDIVFNGKPRHGAAHLRNMMGCYAVYIGNRAQSDERLMEQAAWFAHAFPNRASIAVELQQMPDDDMWQERLTALSDATGMPMVAAGDVHMHVRSRKPLHDTITAIRLGKSIAECGLELHPNAEQHLRQRIRLAQIYSRPLLEQTLEIAARCTFSLDEVSYCYPDDIVPAGETPTSHLRNLTYQGAYQRYPNGVPAKIQELLLHELSLIEELEFEMYFLVAGDIVAFARRQGILCQGRGSAANSVVAYSMFSVDAEGAMMFFDFELDRLVDEWHGPNGYAVKDDRPMSGVAYRYYLQYGGMSLAKNQVGKADEILRRSAFRERIGLAGHQDVQAAATAAPHPTGGEVAAPTEAPAMAQGELILEAA